MLLKYYSNWIITLFIVWYVSYLSNIPIDKLYKSLLLFDINMWWIYTFDYVFNVL